MISRQQQIELYAYTAGVLNARRDYYRRPTRFGNPIYCALCSCIIGEGLGCPKCGDTRNQRARRAKRRAV